MFSLCLKLSTIAGFVVFICNVNCVVWLGFSQVDFELKYRFSFEFKYITEICVQWPQILNLGEKSVDIMVPCTLLCYDVRDSGIVNAS